MPTKKTTHADEQTVALALIGLQVNREFAVLNGYVAALLDAGWTGTRLAGMLATTPQAIYQKRDQHAKGKYVIDLVAGDLPVLPGPGKTKHGNPTPLRIPAAGPIRDEAIADVAELRTTLGTRGSILARLTKVAEYIADAEDSLERAKQRRASLAWSITAYTRINGARIEGLSIAGHWHSAVFFRERLKAFGLTGAEIAALTDAQLAKVAAKRRIWNQGDAVLDDYYAVTVDFLLAQATVKEATALRNELIMKAVDVDEEGGIHGAGAVAEAIGRTAPLVHTLVAREMAKREPALA